MKLVCSQAELATSLALVSRAVSNRPSHPILSCVLLEANSDGMFLTGFDLAMGIRASIAATVNQQGSTCVPIALFQQIVAHLPRDSAITIEASKEKVELRSSSGKYDLSSQEAADYPDFPLIEGQKFSLKPEDFQYVSRGVLHAVSVDESKQLLTGISIKLGDGIFEAAATDGHRLAILSVASDSWQSSDRTHVVIPGRAVKELERLIKEQPDETIYLTHARNQAFFGVGTQILTTRLLEGTYPNYRQLVPPSFSTNVTLNRQAFITALQRVAVIADCHNNVVKIDFSESRALIHADAQDVGSGSEHIAADIEGNSINLAFNATYVIDALKANQCEKIKLSCNAPTTPVVLVPCDQGHERIQLIMPVQIRV